MNIKTRNKVTTPLLHRHVSYSSAGDDEKVFPHTHHGSSVGGNRQPKLKKRATWRKHPRRVKKVEVLYTYVSKTKASLTSPKQWIQAGDNPALDTAGFRVTKLIRKTLRNSLGAP